MIHSGQRAGTITAMLAARLSLVPVRTSQPRVLARSQRRLNELVSFAAERSPFYHEFYRGLPARPGPPLHELPVLSKAEMMNNLDRIFTDPRLTQNGINRHITSSKAADRLFGEYRVVATSGSTGRRGLLAYNRHEWNVLVATFWRWLAMVGMSPRRGRQRLAIIGAPSAFHLSHRLAASIDVGIYHILYLPAGEPASEMIKRLSDFQPELIVSYPSLCAILATEQLEGHLDISPRVIATSGEKRTPEMTDLIRAAWGTPPLDSYAMTETGLVAGECRERGVLHMFNDSVILEVVDDDYQPVAEGTMGSRILVTNLFLRTQPLIRYEVSDMVTMSREACSCRRSWPIIQSLDGRTDDLLWFRDHTGHGFTVHPMQLQSVILSSTGVRAYQIEQQADSLLIRVVVDEHSQTGILLDDLRTRLIHRLELLNINMPTVLVNAVDAIPRMPGPAGKVKLVVSDQRTRQAGSG